MKTALLCTFDSLWVTLFCSKLFFITNCRHSALSGDLNLKNCWFGSVCVAVTRAPNFCLLSVWLQCIRKGAHVVQGAIRGLLTEQAQALKLTYGVQFIINCSGLGSIELAGDKGMFPVRGTAAVTVFI